MDEKIIQMIDEIYPDVVTIRREIHMNPELSQEEKALLP